MQKVNAADFVARLFHVEESSRLAGRFTVEGPGRWLAGNVYHECRESAEERVAHLRRVLVPILERAMRDAAEQALVGHLPGEEMTVADWENVATWIEDQETWVEELTGLAREDAVLDLGVVRMLLCHVQHLDGWLAKLSHDCDAWQAGLAAGRREGVVQGRREMKSRCVAAVEAEANQCGQPLALGAVLSAALKVKAVPVEGATEPQAEDAA